MNVAFETRVLIPVCALTVALSGSAGFSAGAQVHKCKNSEGGTVYQEAPCAKTGSKLDLPAGTGKSGDNPGSDDGTRKSMNEAFQRRMDQRDYDGALAFATNERQRAEARKKLAEKNSRCERLSLKAQKAQAAIRANDARSKAAADAAEAEYASTCR
jgi:hypothetical protein